MTNSILRDSVIIGILAIGATMVVANREKVYEYLNIEPPVMGQKNQTADQTDITGAVDKNALGAVRKLSGIAVSIPKSKSDGQFWTEAKVNSGVVRFLVDTGASAVALTPEDARRAGIRVDTLAYNVPIATAGGENVAAYVNLKSISVGNVTVRNVRALVVPTGLTTSLLGMSYLGELQKVEATPHALILRL